MNIYVNYLISLLKKHRRHNSFTIESNYDLGFLFLHKNCNCAECSETRAVIDWNIMAWDHFGY
jgi:hypothetical protein